jgi:hypothetical protein
MKYFRIFALGIVAMGILTLGCSKHENFPAVFNVTAPPTPSSLVVTNPSGSNYDLSWSISDATNVQTYRVYLISPVGVDPTSGELIYDESLLIESPTTSIMIDTVLPVLPGSDFGVSAVSLDNVEGAMTREPAPVP